MGKYILIILMNCKNKMNIIFSIIRIDWCVFVFYVMLKKKKCYVLNFILL